MPTGDVPFFSETGRLSGSGKAGSAGGSEADLRYFTKKRGAEDDVFSIIEARLVFSGA